jgi:hypothetical protein
MLLDRLSCSHVIVYWQIVGWSLIPILLRDDKAYSLCDCEVVDMFNGRVSLQSILLTHSS